MILGLLDWSLIRWKQPTVFSLDLMKLAHYHKKDKKDIVKMLFEYEQEQTDRIIISKDYEDWEYPELIMQDPKVEYKGLAISEGNYVSLGEDIENRPADTSIYEDMFKYYRRTSEAKALFKNMLNATHMRISLDGETVNSYWKTQLKPKTGRVQHVILHDKNIVAIKGAEGIAQELDSYYGRNKVRLGFKFPIQIENDEELRVWGQLTKSTGISNIALMDMISDAVLDEVSLFKQQFTYEIAPPRWNKKKMIYDLPNIFMQGRYLSKWGIPLQLRFSEKLRLEDYWTQFELLFNDYMRASTAYRNSLVFSLFVFTKYIYLGLQREEKIQLFRILKEEIPELFELAYHLEYVSFDGHEFTPHLYTWKEVSDFGGYGGYYYREGKKQEEKEMLSQYNYANVVTPEYLYLF